jgi:hypothetical protein
VFCSPQIAFSPRSESRRFGCRESYESHGLEGRGLKTKTSLPRSALRKFQDKKLDLQRLFERRFFCFQTRFGDAKFCFPINEILNRPVDELLFAAWG